MSTSAPPPNAQRPAIDAWTMLAQIGERLRASPDQPKLRLLGAQAAATLGLPELAERWLQSAERSTPDDPEMSPQIARLRHLLQGISPAERSPGQRIEAARTHLERINSPGPVTTSDFDRWASEQARQIVWTLPDRGVVRFDPDLPVEAEPNIPALSDLDQSATRHKLPDNVEDSGWPPAPIVLVGGVTARLLRRLQIHFQPLPAGGRARLLVVEPDAHRLLDAIAALDESADTHRFEWHPDEASAIDALRETRDRWTSISLIGTRPQTATTEVAQSIRSLTVSVQSETERAIRQADEHYARAERADWADRFRTALSKQAEPLRVMIITTRFSTYLQHAATDISTGIDQAGHASHVLIEPENTDRLTRLSIANAINEFRPDALIVLNYTRSVYRDIIPETIPYICWVQDAMPHLYDKKAGRDIDARTLVVGNLTVDLLTEHGYPRDRCLTLGVPASETKFAAHIKNRPPVDLFLATNHGETPDEMATRLERLHTEQGGAPGLVWEIARAVIDRVGQWQTGHSVWWLEDQIRDVLASRQGQPDDALVADLLRDIARPVLNRVLRHQLVTSAVELATRRDWKLVIAGKGWEAHPGYARYAIGEIRHGPALRDAYSDALLTLHTSASWLMHQRLHECVLAGGLPAVMLKTDDDAGVMHPGFVDAWRNHRPTCSRIENRKRYISAIDSEVAAISLATMQRIRRDTTQGACARDYDAARLARTGQLVWGLGTDREWFPADHHTTPIENARYLHALSDTMFWSTKGLESLVDRCHHDPRWRESRIEHLRGLVRTSYTYEAIVPDLLHRLGDVLSRRV